MLARFALLLSLFAPLFAEETFLLYHNETPLVSQGPHQTTPFPPWCTFNIPLALIGFETGHLESAQYPLWPYHPHYNASREVCQKAHNPKEWMQHSCVWFSKKLVREVGLHTISRSLNAFHYGEGCVTPELLKWQFRNLRLTPQEQGEFLSRLCTHRLPLHSDTIAKMEEVLHIAVHKPYLLFGKTGTGPSYTGKTVAWFVGWAKEKESVYPFVFLTDAALSRQARYHKVSSLIEGALPHLKEEQHTDVKNAFLERWIPFCQKKEFIPFTPNRSEVSLRDEFHALCLTRQALWEQDAFAFSQPLIDMDRIRTPGCGAFAYNNTTPEFNASTLLCVGGTVIVCEAPQEKNVPTFFQMLNTQGVEHVVRLTPTCARGRNKCFPYWEGSMDEKGESLSIGEGKTVSTTTVEQWHNHHALSTETLGSLAQEVREVMKTKKCCIHCSSGVGRSGTLMAAIAILDCIDRGETLSIEKIVLELSMQRIFSVAQPAQYISLYRLAEWYS